MLSTQTNWVHPSHVFRRRHERKNYSADIVFALNGSLFQGKITDISVGGAFIQTEQVGRFCDDDRITVSIPFTDGNNHVKRTGRILWKNSAGFAIAF